MFFSADIIRNLRSGSRSLRHVLFPLAVLSLALILNGCGGGGGSSASPATYVISGVITDNGGGVAGITVDIGGEKSARAVTDAGGAYSISGLPAGTYTVTPSSATHDFAPANIQLEITGASITGQNFTATSRPPNPGSYTVSGRITLSNGNGVPGVVVGIGGAQSAQTVTDGNGNYSFTGLTGGTYTITPTSGSYSFSAPQITLNNIAGDRLNQNFTATQKSGSITIIF